MLSAGVLALRIEQTWIPCGTIRLHARIYIPDVVPAPVVLVCHGMNMRGSEGLRIYYMFAETACHEGFVCLVFDFRGTGHSEGSFDYGVGERKDVKSALDFLMSRPEAISDEVFVVGHSLGGAVSLYALRDETRAKGLVLWSTPKNHNYNVKKFIRHTRGTRGLYGFLVISWIDKVINTSLFFKLEVYGVNLRPKYVREKLMKIDECDAASKLHGLPLLVVVGRSDSIVGVDEAEEIYRSANEPKSLLIIESADHVYRGKEQELINRTIEWIKGLWQKQTAK
jgi:alpha/beta superfamily hydrolase